MRISVQFKGQTFAFGGRNNNNAQSHCNCSIKQIRFKRCFL